MFAESLLKEKDNKILWFPVFIGTGILLFSLEHFTAAIILLMLIVASIILQNKNIYAITSLIILGFTAIFIRVSIIDTKFIDKTIYVNKAVATVREINQKISYKQIVLQDIKHYKLKSVSNIRIKAYKVDKNVKSGDIVSFSAKLTPPTAPVSPNAYDFANFAYFEKISAVGFATTPITLVQPSNKLILTSYIDSFRNYIALSLIKLMGKKTGNITAALIVGKRQGIDKKILEDIRNAGLAHLLAISGLHLTIVTSFFFLLSRKLFALSTHLATKYNTKKWAAIISISASFSYLTISGMSISAQRAFIMSSIILFAILIDRHSSTMRSITVAATIILVFEPESILKPSFQMSFAAVIGLCAFYESYKDKLNHSNMFYRTVTYFLTIVISSIIASLATTPYTIHHFNYFSLGGIISNLVAIPLTTIIILPFGIITTCLIPLHLSYLPALITSKAINILILISSKIGNMHYAFIPIHVFGNLSIIIITFGFLWLCLWQQRWRLFGIPTIIIGLIIGLNNKTPDILVNEKMVAVKGSDNNLYFLSRQRKNFVNRTWIAQNGQSDIYLYTEHKNNDKVNISCKDSYCIYNNNGKSTLFLYSKLLAVNTEKFDYVIQLRDFPIKNGDKITTFSQIQQGYFLWLK